MHIDGPLGGPSSFSGRAGLNRPNPPSFP